MTRLSNVERLTQPKWRRRLSGLSAVLAAVAFVCIGGVPQARADDVDQIVGHGDTPSAVTVRWSQGLLGADNRTVVAERDAASPYAFMHADFENLTIRVSQTTNLVNQAVQVTWTGGLPTQQPFKSNFLQLMQCYGDAFTGPDPEGCQFGSAGLISGAINPGIGTRTGSLCVSPQPSVTDPPGTQDGSGPSVGCDPSEPRDSSHVDPCPAPQICGKGRYSVPFVPVGTTDKIYGEVTAFYDEFNTNEVQQASTGADGTGQQSFQTLTATQAPGLGCGLLKPDGQPRGCWLVIVPRGTYEPNGWKLTPSTGIPGFVNESPVGAASWAQRVQVHLSFNNVPTSCAIGSAKERPLVGTELVARAVFSWQIALNAAASCRTIFGYAATRESVNTTQLASEDGAGLAFTTIPIGSETSRSGGPPGPVPPLVYAPVAISAITFGFHINQSTGLVRSSIKLTPRLLAKTLTQSYRFDLPDVDSNHPGPDWARTNPDFITRDPEFIELNPDIITPGAGLPLAPLLTEDHSDINRQVWSWILSDSIARAWLRGEPDEHGMTVNPHYRQLQLDASAIDSYPRADPTCFRSDNPAERVPRCSLDLLPYVRNLDDAATRVRAANNPLGAAWDPLKLAPDGQTGWWSNGGVEPAGRIFLWAVTGSPELAGLGLVPAALCRADGTGCLTPSATSVGSALSAAERDASGLLHIDPAAPGDGAYPLVAVTYAAVRTDQSPAALRDYASFILYAASTGQSPGVEPGRLPRGYLPLPTQLRDEAVAAAKALTDAAFGQPPATGTDASPPTPQANVQRPPQPTVAALRTPEFRISPLAPVPDSFTPTTQLGPVRWTLLGIILVGLVGAIGGPLVRMVGRRLVLRAWRK